MGHGKKLKIRIGTGRIRIYLFFLFFSVSIFIGCISYDSAVIYHKNFQPGSHEKLRFDGYYTNTSSYQLTTKIRPMFFYRDGSVWCAEEDITELEIQMGSTKLLTDLKHSWGNFKIEADTIYVERFVQETNTGNFNRIIMKGLVQDSSIFWKQRTFHKSEPDSVNYDVHFKPMKSKPDSTKNWTRTHPPYNK